MEKRRVIGSAMMIFLVIGMVIGEAKAVSFKDCYKGCFVVCAITPGKNILGCAAKCLKDCIFPPSFNSLPQEHKTHYFCNFGCASSFCSNLSTRQDPREKEVGSCVDSCSNTCSKNYSP